MVDEFSGYLCWDKIEAADTISTEAVSPSPAIFFATHAPLRIHRNSPDGARAENLGGAVDEQEVLRDFLTRPTANGVLLMPVVGDSGTGKSHLVRWVKERTPSTAKRHVIYLEKARTSLRSIVEALLAEVRGDELDQLKSDVLRMGTEISRGALEQRLLNYLQEALTEASPSSASERALAGPQKLELVLRDALLREHLLQEGRLIPRLAAHLWSDRESGDPDRPLTFTLDDLPLNLVSVDDAAAATKRICTLIQTRPELQTAALELLNRHLDVAVMNAMNLGVGRLQKAMIEIRREFARQGKEIILLIEDFALIQGIQRDLLESIIEVGIRDGRTVLAPIRTLLAITPEPFQRLVDTVATRAKAATPYIYDLDQQFADGPDASADAASFVGRYLNAARVGRDGLEDAADQTTGEVPNSCDECRFRDHCHRAFGVSREGYGLYPFNKHSLKRMIHSRALPEKPHAFNPRAVVGEVARNVLVEHADAIREGSFPDARFREEYPVAEIDTSLLVQIRDTLADLDPADAERRVTLLEFWGNAPTQVVNLDPVLHGAFQIGELATDSAAEVQVVNAQHHVALPRSQYEVPRTADSDALSPGTKKALADIEAWAVRETSLPQALANDLRRMVRDVIVRRCQWMDPLMPEPTADVLRKAWPAKSTVVSIQDAIGEGLDTANTPIRFARTNANAAFFQGILKAAAGVLEGNAAHVRRLNEIGDKYESHLKRAVLQVRGTNDNQLAVALRASLLGAALAGRAAPGLPEAELLAAALDDGGSWARADNEIRTGQWTKAWERHAVGRAELIRGICDGIGIAQGTRGGVSMIDAVRALPLLRGAAKSWTWQAPEQEAPAWAKKAIARLGEWDDLVYRQVDALQQHLSKLRLFLPQGVSGRDTVLGVEAALDAALKAGIAPQDIERVRQDIKQAQAYDWAAVRGLEQDLARVQTAEHGSTAYRRYVIIAATTDRGPDLGAALGFLQSSNTWMSERLEVARMRESTNGENTLRQVDALLARWASIVSVEAP
jgi:hypothetical protein